MACVSPPELDDIQLLTYLDGVPDRQVADHLGLCAYCRARAARFGRMEARLRAGLYRRACPSASELGEYRLGMLARREAAAIAQHLAGCPHCAREVARLESFLGDLAPSPEPSAAVRALDQMRVLVARLVGGARGALSAPVPALAPAYAGLRGTEQEAAVYEAEGVQVAIGVQPDAGASGRQSLLGLVTGVDPRQFTAALWQGGRLVAMVPLDDGGNFLIPDVAPAVYELVLSAEGQEIYIEELRI